MQLDWRGIDAPQIIGPMRCLAAFVALLAVNTAVAQSALQSESAQCRDALDALESAEREAIARARRVDAAPAPASTPALDAARPRAARACLGGPHDPPPAASVRVPAPAPAPRVPAPPAAAPRAPVAAPPAPARAPAAAPAVVTNCDAAGCWTSERRWLPRAGPNLVGPRGVCTVQGRIVKCP